MIEELRAALIDEHRKVVSEWSGNFGGHVGIRDGWVEYDEDTVIERCEVCDLIRVAAPSTEPALAVEHERIVSERVRWLDDEEDERDDERRGDRASPSAADKMNERLG